MWWSCAVLTPIGTRALGRRQVIGLTAFVLAIELAIGLPFLAVSPHHVRGIPGPLLIVTCLTGSFFLGPRIGFGLTAVAVALAVLLIDDNPVFDPLFWLPISVVIGAFGERARRGERLRQELIGHLQNGLVALAREPVVGPVRATTRYRPAEREQLIAGDFYGVVMEPDGNVAMMVGDVAGHGPGAAAVATHLRAAWRALAVAGTPGRRVVEILHETLEAEQQVAPTVTFASLCVASINADARQVCVVLAGHAPPILVVGDSSDVLDAHPGPPIGLRRAGPWEAFTIDLPQEPWTLVLYTDGLVEGRVEPGSQERFGPDRLVAALARLGAPLDDDSVDALLRDVQAANGGPMSDDVVVLAVSPQSVAVADVVQPSE
jgi:membrane protein implicated in regulation of membrane protease activity